MVKRLRVNAEWATVIVTLVFGVVAGCLAASANTVAKAANELGQVQADIAARQAELAFFDSTQSCIMYREQVLTFFEYGMSAADIEALLEKENEFVVNEGTPQESGVEKSCGYIADLEPVARQAADAAARK